MNRRRTTRKIPNPSDFKAAFCRPTYCNPKQNGGILIAKLIVAEKPSVAMSYAKVLGATSRQDGYLEGNGYLVSWCVGHLVELAPPNVYDAKYVKWSIADLPILPQKWQYLVSASTKKQFGIQRLPPIIRSTADYAPPEVVDGKPPIYPYTPIKSSFEDAGSVEDMMLYTELEAAVHAMIQRLEYSFTFNPSLLTIPKRKQQVAEILKEAETYIWRIKEEMRCA